MKFYAGLLLMYGITSAGKSTTGLALAFEAGLQGVKTGHMVWDEVSSLTPTKLTPIDKVNLPDPTIFFDEPTAANTESPARIVNSYLSMADKFISSDGLRLMILDSLGPSLGVSSGLVDQPAGRGAMVEGYGMYLRAMNEIGYKNNCTIIGMVNSSLFTVSSLEGACDGLIEITARGAFQKRDRTDRVSWREFALTKEAVLRSMVAQGSANATAYNETNNNAEKGIL